MIINGWLEIKTQGDDSGKWTAEVEKTRKIKLSRCNFRLIDSSSEGFFYSSMA